VDAQATAERASARPCWVMRERMLEGSVRVQRNPASIRQQLDELRDRMDAQAAELRPYQRQRQSNYNANADSNSDSDSGLDQDA